MRQRAPLTEVLAAAARVLSGRGQRWYLFGAQAVVVWGRPRLTSDVDITMELEPEAAAGFCADMERAGFQLRVSNRDDFLARARVLPFLHSPTEFPLDIVLAGPGLEEQFLDRAATIDMDGVAVQVIAPEDLIITKILAGRPKDLEDVHSVLELRGGSLDLEYMQATLRLLEEAPAQSDLLRTLEAALARTTWRSASAP